MAFETGICALSSASVPEAAATFEKLLADSESMRGVQAHWSIVRADICCKMLDLLHLGAELQSDKA